MKIINLYNHKGGVGKTTISVHLANKLNKIGNTLLIELDDQANVLINCNIQEEVQKELDSSNLFPLGVFPLMQNMDIDKFIYEREEEFDIIINNELSSLEASVKNDTKTQQTVFQNFFTKIESLDKYEYIVIDNPPSQYELVLECLRLSTNILIPFDCEDSSTRAVLDTLTLFVREDIDLESIKGVIPNKYLHFHKAIHDENIQTIKEAVDFEGSNIKVYELIKNAKKYKEVERSVEYTELLDDVVNDIKISN